MRFLSKHWDIKRLFDLQRASSVLPCYQKAAHSRTGKGGKTVTDAERLQTIDLVNGTSPAEDVLWALTYLLNLPDEDDLPLFAPAQGA